MLLLPFADNAVSRRKVIAVSGASSKVLTYFGTAAEKRIVAAMGNCFDSNTE